MESRVEQDGPEGELGIRCPVPENDHLAEQAGRLEGMAGDRVQYQEPHGDRDPADQANVRALADDRVTAIRHANLEPRAGRPPDRHSGPAPRGPVTAGSAS